MQSLVFALVQAGVRPNLAAWLDVGPSRAMQGLMAKNNMLVQKKVRLIMCRSHCGSAVNWWSFIAGQVMMCRVIFDACE
jgi:hypothetical protein